MRAFAPQAIVVMNFDQILRAACISIAKAGVVNVHPSLLPSFRGPCPVFWALAEQRQTMGASLHVIEDAQIDAGPVLTQARREIDPSLSVAEITSQLFCDGAALMPMTLARLIKGQVEKSAQGADADADADYWGFPQKNEVRRALRTGIRLWRIGHVVRVIAAASGLIKWKASQPIDFPFDNVRIRH